MFEMLSLKGGLSNVEGIYTQGVSAGFKPNNQPDIAFIRSDTLCEIESIFTTNKFCAAPIKHYKKYPKNFKTNFILINSKNANALTGPRGIEDIEKILSVLRKKYKEIQNPIMSSTGVIGYRLDTDKIINSFDKFDMNAKDSNSAARAIMTTDSFEKDIAFKVIL